jgi:hypothetical protein
MRILRRRFFSLLLSVSGCLLVCVGCATYKPLPPGYTKDSHVARVVVRQMPATPQMMDSGGGGLVGAIITATSRADRMREQLAGIEGPEVQQAFLEEFTQRMSEHLTLADKNEDLRIEVSVMTWGWFLPTIDFGIKVGEYQSHIIGRVEIYDNALNKKVAFAYVRASRPIGTKPIKETARKAVGEVARAFASETEEALIHCVKPAQSGI